MDDSELERIKHLAGKQASPKTDDSFGAENGFQPGGKQLSSYAAPEIRPESIRHSQPEKLNEYKSASVLMKAISDEAMAWKSNLPNNFRPAILAVLSGGIQIHVESLSQISFHGIRVAGSLNGSPCSIFAHQSTLQLLCYAEEVVENQKKNPIGFIWDGQRVDV